MAQKKESPKIKYGACLKCEGVKFQLMYVDHVLMRKCHKCGDMFKV